MSGRVSSRGSQGQQGGWLGRLAGRPPAKTPDRAQPPCKVEIKVTLSPSHTSASSSPLRQGVSRQAHGMSVRRGEARAGKQWAQLLHGELHTRVQGASCRD